MSSTAWRSQFLSDSTKVASWIETGGREPLEIFEVKSQTSLKMIRIFAAILLMVLSLGLLWRYFAHESSKRVTPTAMPSSSSPNLVNDDRAGVVYKLPPKDRELLLQSVNYYCVNKYHRDSCIHHLITCGIPCLVAIPKAQRRIVFADYQKLRAERGLPPLPKVSHTDDDE